jgi:hypothetical protein
MEANAAFIESLNASEEPLFCEVSDVPGIGGTAAPSCDPFAGVGGGADGVALGTGSGAGAVEIMGVTVFAPSFVPSGTGAEGFSCTLWSFASCILILFSLRR